MSTSRWIVVANASFARVLRHDAHPDALVLLDTLRHPQSRARGRDLEDDRPGHHAADHRPGGTRFEPRLDARRKEHRLFAREIAEHLDDAWARGAFEAVTLVAPAAFLGDLRQELSGAVRQSVQGTIDSDLTALNVRDNQARLRDLHADA